MAETARVLKFPWEDRPVEVVVLREAEGMAMVAHAFPDPECPPELREFPVKTEWLS